MSSLHDVNDYEREGFVTGLHAISETHTDQYRELSERLELLLGGRPAATRLTQLHRHFLWAHELSCVPEVLERVKMVIGPDIGIWSTALFIKYPSDEAYVGWHQDGRYWAMLSDQVVTAWIALSPSTRHNGCLLVVPGSHRRGLLPHREGVSSTNILSRQQEVALDITDTEVRRLELSPGEFSLHHVNLVHGSGPNETNQKRVGFVIRYIGPSVQQYGARLDVTMAAGEAASFRHANVVAAPKSNDMVAELEKFESTVRSFRQEVRRAADALGRDRRETRDA